MKSDGYKVISMCGSDIILEYHRRVTYILKNNQRMNLIETSPLVLHTEVRSVERLSAKIVL